ncbi:MAG: imidazole glycerol phosphate synthase subunit HisH [Nitrospiraceae bacterium]|nr:imidazole glycerol phosphate synthase subunit HisH [Nitrospiraceae bacterium]
MIAVVDYGMGNLRSVEKALQMVGADARIVSSAQAVKDARGVVLPGVGAFSDCMRNLESQGLKIPVLDAIKSGKPFLGICLGLQLLFTESCEFGRHEGLGVFAGKVVRFPEQTSLKVPHMGWNSISIINKAPLLEDIQNGASFYFVHSYYVVPEDASITATTTSYGVEYTSMVWKDNVFATQFHPEKSQAVGLNMLASFKKFVEKN